MVPGPCQSPSSPQALWCAYPVVPTGPTTVSCHQLEALVLSLFSLEMPESLETFAVMWACGALAASRPHTFLIPLPRPHWHRSGSMWDVNLQPLASLCCFYSFKSMVLLTLVRLACLDFTSSDFLRPWSWSLQSVLGRWIWVNSLILWKNSL